MINDDLIVDGSAFIGIRTSTPSVEIHVIDGDTPTLRLQQDGSSGFAPQTWDVAGNETNFFIRDITNGSKLPFRIRPSAPTSSIFIDTTGDIGMDTASPDYPLHVYKSGANAEILAERASGAQAQLGAAASLAYFGSRTDHEVRFQVNSDWRMRLNPTANSTILEITDGGYYDGTWNGSSSREFKENIQGLTGDEAMKALSAMDVVAVLTKVVKEQQKMMQKQQKNISQLKKEINTLKKNK